MIGFEDMVRACAVLSSCVLGSLAIAWYRRPSILLDAYAWYKIVIANLRIRYIMVDGTTIRYAVRLPGADPSTWKMFSKADISNILRLRRAVETSSVSERMEDNEKRHTGDGMDDLENENEGESDVKHSAEDSALLSNVERENGPQRSVIIFVHGFSSDLSTWYGLIRALDPCETVYCVDLPGHGGSERRPSDTEDLSAMGFTRFLRRFILAAQLDTVRVHLVGQSLGGTIVGIYASLYPQHVAGLTLISPAVEPPFVTEFAARLNARDYSWLLPTSLDGCAVVFERNFASHWRAKKIPKQLRRAFLDQRMRKIQYYRSVLDALNTTESRCALIRCAGEIRVPTQLMWGCDDQITHVSACSMLQDLIGINCIRVDLFERCGHAINEEAGTALFNCFRHFREQLLAIQTVSYAPGCHSDSSCSCATMAQMVAAT